MSSRDKDAEGLVLRPAGFQNSGKGIKPIMRELGLAVMARTFGRAGPAGGAAPSARNGV